MIQWGCIADDVTGATDLATSFVERGLRTAVFFGVPDPGLIEQSGDLDVAVVALKSRTAPVDDAVTDSLAALAALQDAGAERFYLKYCSTFDSTATGNIGPVMDAVLSQLRETVTIVVPSFPAAGRTVYQGRLFVGDQPLDESPMRDHPLTPMRDSSLLRLLAQQSTATVRLVPLQTVRRGPEFLRAEIERISAAETGAIALVIDAIDESDLATIMRGTSDLRVVTGGSGLAQGLPATETAGVRSIPHTPGFRAVLCGSASARTREQVQIAKTQLPWRKLTVSELRRDAAREANAVIEWAKDVWRLDPGAVPLIFSVESLDDVKAGNSNVRDSESDSDLIEKALGLIARGFVSAGVRELVVAGGESSGRVVRDLGIAALRIGPEIDTGVAWSAGTTSDGVPITIALKSGNFGQPTMFANAWESISPAEVLADGAAS